MSELLQTLKEMVKKDCQAPANRLDAAFYDLHLVPVEKHALKLCRHVSADKELVSLAAYLHDLAVIRDYSCLAAHHLAGAELAGELLKNNLPAHKLAVLQEAISNHNLPCNNASGESLALSNADAMSKLDAPFFWIAYAYKHKFQNFSASVHWYRELVTSTYAMLIDSAQAMIKDKYEVVLNFIENEVSAPS